MSILEKMNMTAAKATEVYIQLRDKKKQMDDAHKASTKKLVDAMEKLEGALLEHLNDAGADSVACGAGTAYKSTQMNATVADKDAFMAFVKETEQFEALDIKANKNFVKDYLSENQEAPPGVKVTQIQIVGVQRR